MICIYPYGYDDNNDSAYPEDDIVGLFKQTRPKVRHSGYYLI